MAMHYELTAEDGDVIDVFTTLDSALSYLARNYGPPIVGEALPHYPEGTASKVTFTNSTAVLYLCHVSEDEEPS